jgi:sigma-B regulation protein RsbU (phosphoserine phosphatase)
LPTTAKERLLDAEETRLLIVHGSATKREMLRRRLEEVGYHAAVAADANEALEKVKREEFDVVILDVAVPGLPAEWLIAQLQTDKIARAIPVILVGQPGDAETVGRCLEAGADDYLYEPLSITLLRTQVRENIQISARRRQELRRAEREDLLKIERDVEIARTIQRDFLPTEIPQPAGWEIAARLRPARQVAGDFYDTFPLTQGRRVALVIADVCDKGVGAALFMALFRSLFRAYSQQASSRWMTSLGEGFMARRGEGGQRIAPTTGTIALKNAMELTNDYMVNNHASLSMFATVFFGVLDPSSGQLTYVNGGHNPPVVVKPSGPLVRLKPTGPAVGLLPDVKYRMEQVQLDPGDLFFAFTDGVPDARNLAGQGFTEARMLELFTQPEMSATEPIDRVDAALQTHIGEASQYDDITLLAAWRRPAGDGS